MICQLMSTVILPYSGGNGEIRTHGALTLGSFQDCCNKPDSATFPNLVEITGIEPVVPEGGGFTVHCITIDASSPNSYDNFYSNK